MPWRAGAHICRCLRRPGIDSEKLIRKFQHRAGIFKHSMGTRNRVGIVLLYWPARARFCEPFKEPGIDSQPGWIFRICGINRIRFASIFLGCRISRVRYASIFTSSGISRFVLLRYRKRSQDRSFVPPSFPYR
jgi:hypothetical protein